MVNLEKMEAIILENGGVAIRKIDVKSIRFDIMFRGLCESKTCGAYGKTWMCPPHIAPVEVLIDKAKGYKDAYVFQTISKIEDSFDIEGMLLSAKAINRLARVLKESLVEDEVHDFLILAGGACRYCDSCSVNDGSQCRFPDKAIASIESYGIDAMSLSEESGLNYINGKNTVTYFGVILHN